MVGLVQRVFLKLDAMKETWNLASSRASRIVEEGSRIVHHEVPSKSIMLPYPMGHCPLSSQPLYPPPSMERPQREGAGNVAKVVLKCLFMKVRPATSRPDNELAKLPKPASTKTDKDASGVMKR